MSETNELKFQKLAEVELLEKAPEGSHPLVEHDGKIKRVTGGLGGAGISVFDLTPYVTAENYTLIDECILSVAPSFTEQEVEDFIKLAAAGAISVHLDVAVALGMETGQGCEINQVFSTQYLNGSAELPIRGVALYTGILDILLLRDAMDKITLVGYEEGIPRARFVFPVFLGLL